MAAAIEDSHDDYGPIWPVSIAPFEVHICALQYNSDARVKETADRLYQALTARGLDVLLGDTDDKPGAQFADADLIGAPLRLVVATKSLDRSAVEFKTRDGSQKGEWELSEVENKACEVVEALHQSLMR